MGWGWRRIEEHNVVNFIELAFRQVSDRTIYIIKYRGCIQFSVHSVGLRISAHYKRKLHSMGPIELAFFIIFLFFSPYLRFCRGKRS